MFITIQYPLFDLRNLDAEIKRVARPNWYNPDAKDRIRYTGDILTKKKNYKGPWDSDSYFCNAQHVINLCGTGDSNYFKSLRSAAVQSNILFRRLQSDGNFLAKYEIGFRDQFEIKLVAGLDSTAIQSAFIRHIRTYLNCPIKIKVGNKLRDYIPLGDASDYLKLAYYWATLKGTKSFDDKDLRFAVESLDPFIVLHVDKAKIPLPTLGFKQVNQPEQEMQRLELYYGSISYQPNASAERTQMDAWIIGSDDPTITYPANKQDFASWPDAIKDLRKNILKVPTVVKTYKKLNSLVQAPQPIKDIGKEVVQLRIAKYFHKAGGILLENNAFSRDQREIVGLAIDPDYRKGSNDILKEEINNAILWMQGINQVEIITKMKNELETRLNNYLDTRTPEMDARDKKPLIYFSYAWGDEHETGESREKLINELYDALLKNGFELRRDKMNLQYGGLITDFMKAIGEGDLIIIGISDKYLKSPYCMWELNEIWRNCKEEKNTFLNRILPLKIEKIDLSLKAITPYLTFWQKEFDDLSKIVNPIINQISDEQFNAFKRVQTVYQNFGKLSGILNDTNTLTRELIMEEDFKVIKQTILERIRTKT